LNAAAFRDFYEYHFSENRKLWERYIRPLPADQFSRPAAYSQGSVRDQLLHILSADEAWFGDLRAEMPPPLPADTSDLNLIRQHWDRVEQAMRAYLAGLRDGMLAEKPISGEDQGLYLWQILLHVVNHGTDHRAQILRLLNDLGVQTGYQDYIFYVYQSSQQNAPGAAGAES
jgi:uncharacterized damage-inducible protein DinB